jgi:hypothetical protein
MSLLNRVSRDFPFVYYLPDLYRTVNIGSFCFSLWFFIQATLYFVLIIILSQGDQNKNDLMIGTIIILVALPLLTNCVGLRYFCWSAPMFYIIIILKKKCRLIRRIIILEVLITFLYVYANFLYNLFKLENIMFLKLYFNPLIASTLMFILFYYNSFILIRELIKLKNNVF